MRRSIFIFPLLILISGCWSKGPPVVSYSDYFLFLGRDDQGFVAFAIDNERQKDEDRYLAENFVVLYDEKQGWVDVLGKGVYKNGDKVLRTIPNSAYFDFSGSSSDGFLIKSRENGLVLRTEGIVVRLSRSGDDGLYQKGSAEGVLEWKGRKIRGRVIYEYLYNPGFKRFTRGAFSVYDDYHGLYLMVSGVGDIYFHHRKGKHSSILKKRDGFLFLEGKTFLNPFREVKPTTSRQGFGFYRWPIDWDGQVRLDGHQASLTIHTKVFKKIKGWFLGGFATSIVGGTLKLDGKEYALYGLAELII